MKHLKTWWNGLTQYNKMDGTSKIEKMKPVRWQKRLTYKSKIVRIYIYKDWLH